IHVVEMTLRHDRRITRRDEADDVRLQQAIGGLAHAEIAVFRVAPQTIRPKVFRSEVTDIERLLRPCLRLRACSNRILARRLSRSCSFASVFAMVRSLPYGLLRLSLFGFLVARSRNPTPTSTLFSTRDLTIIGV